MASPAIINLDSLLAPISDTAPAGVNLRADISPTSPYYQLKDARSGARAAERRADSEGENAGGVLAEWQIILSSAPKALAGNSKDLEVAVWFTEALVRLNGFAGLRDGLQLVRGLVERYWDTFFSLEDEDGLVTRLAPLAGLNGVGTDGTLIQPLRKVPVTVRTDAGSLAAYHYDAAWSLSQVGDPEVRARREAAGEVTMEKFLKAVNASGGEFYMSLLEDLDGSIAELASLGRLLDERAGRESPSWSDIKSVLTGIRDTVENFSRDLVARARAAQQVGSTAAAAAVGADAGAGIGFFMQTGTVSGRDDALRILAQVAEYFRKFEPHSPISTSLDEIVRRARMPFAELLAELLPDTAAWRSALTSAGIKPPAEQS